MNSNTNSGRALIVSSLTAGTGTQVVKVFQNDYNELINKPTINNRELVGNFESNDFVETLTNMEIEALIQGMA